MMSDVRASVCRAVKAAPVIPLAPYAWPTHFSARPCCHHCLVLILLRPCQTTIVSRQDIFAVVLEHTNECLGFVNGEPGNTIEVGLQGWDLGHKYPVVP